MNYKDQIANEYFNWLYDLMCGGRYAKGISYKKLLSHMHGKEFRYLISRDENRADDGIDLRYRFAVQERPSKIPDEIAGYLDGPCSVLEMMAALAIRCEEGIMEDPTMGDRTQQWFWGMVVNLGLGGMHDRNYNRRAVDDILERFLEHQYDSDGKGGLFRVRGCNRDMRTAEIWYQMCWYLDTIT